MATVLVGNTTPIQLDWLVAKCLGEDEENTLDPLTWVHTAKPTRCWDFSTKWAQGGPIIEEMLKSGVTTWNFLGDCFFELAEENILQKGSTPLIAGLRCYVASKLGDVVEIPECL